MGLVNVRVSLLLFGNLKTLDVFKGINKSELPVEYFSQPKAWMTGEMLHKVLAKIDTQLKIEGRFVILFMDNAGCHLPDIKEKYSNMKIVYLPPNTNIDVAAP